MPYDSAHSLVVFVDAAVIVDVVVVVVVARRGCGFWVVLALTECVVFINNPIMYDYAERVRAWL